MTPRDPSDPEYDAWSKRDPSNPRPADSSEGTDRSGTHDRDAVDAGRGLAFAWLSCCVLALAILFVAVCFQLGQAEAAAHDARSRAAALERRVTALEARPFPGERP